MIGGATKVTIKEAVVVAIAAGSFFMYVRSNFIDIKHALKTGWTVQMQSEWQTETERSGRMPNPFDVQRRVGTPQLGALTNRAPRAIVSTL